ncbi:uncharacterized protein LOC114755750 [Neltuma alba]|uniref:uncharacterized protein LOC114755750 n=1 Tax=Neltuma alba TaxID=207710 RepID=UPI0010A3EC94|nr:uncharacterized protein LOC114755750 [Prosopis alba]
MVEDSGSSTDNPSQPRDASDQERQLQDEAVRVQRGLCVMQEVVKAQIEGKRFVVQWNKKGQAVRSNKFISYIGVVARSTVPITVQHWKRVDCSVRDAIWTDVSDPSIADESEVPSLIQDSVKPEDWAAFVTSCRDSQFQELSTQNKKRVKNEYPYQKGRLGYAVLEQNKDGQIDNPRIKEVVDRMNPKANDKKALVTYSADDQDILRRALGTPDHPGLLKGVSYGVTKRDYFRYRQKPSLSCTPSSAKFMELKEETCWLKEQVKAQALQIEQLIKNQAP